MTRILLIELSAYRAFAWAEEVLSDADLEMVRALRLPPASGTNCRASIAC